MHQVRWFGVALRTYAALALADWIPLGRSAVRPAGKTATSVGWRDALLAVHYDHKRCFFCGGKGLSKEHVWPRWMAKYLPVQQGFGQFYVRTMSDERALERIQPRKALSHEITSLTARVVCEPCNNQWMSR